MRVYKGSVERYICCTIGCQALIVTNRTITITTTSGSIHTWKDHPVVTAAVAEEHKEKQDVEQQLKQRLQDMEQQLQQLQLQQQQQRQQQQQQQRQQQQGQYGYVPQKQYGDESTVTQDVQRQHFQQNCIYFYSSGGCRAGNDCRFGHNR
jgi:flagellar biosynthesis GTPase FlhF